MGQLFFEFIEQNGSYLVFYDQEGIRGEELNAVQVRMLQQYSIERLLPIEFEEKDLKLRLRYNISGTKMLSQVLKYRRMSMSEYYDILLRTVLMLSDCKKYMLDEDKHVLHENFIFVGEQLTDIYFVYLPTENVGLTGSVPERLKQLATTLIAFVDGMNAAGFQAILQYFYTESFTLAGIQELLHRLELRTDDAQVQPTSTPSFEQAASSVGKLSTAMEREAMLSPGRPKEQHETATQNASHEAEDPLLRALDIKPKKATKKSNKSGKGQKQGGGRWLKPIDPKRELQLRNIALAALAIGAALVLKDVLEKGNAGWLSLYWLLVLLAVVLLVRYQWVKRRKTPAPVSESESGPSNPAAGGAHEGDEHIKDQSHRERSVPQVPHQPEPVRIVGPEVPTENYYEALPLFTSMLGDSGSHSTGLLGFDNSDSEEDKKALSYLVVRREGLVERIAVHKDVFRIGSQEDVVHYCEDVEGVSRTHLEIIKKSGKNIVRDLGSRNGTFLNGTRLAPYREYLLNNDDKLLIAQTEFQFFYSLKGEQPFVFNDHLLAALTDGAGGFDETII